METLNPVVGAVSAELGIEEYRAELLPEEKASFIESLEAEGHRVFMVGDGINDALALSKASLGVALGSQRPEAALEAADIVLAHDDLTGVVYVRELSRRTHQIIEQSFRLANTHQPGRYFLRRHRPAVALGRRINCTSSTPSGSCSIPAGCLVGAGNR